MKNKMVFAALLAFMACSAQASIVWQPAPPDKVQQAAAGVHAGHGGHGDRGGGMAFVLHNAGGGYARAEAELWLPTRVRRPLPLTASGEVSVNGTGINSFHLLFAKREQGASEEVAMRYLYLQGKPIEISPAELVDAPKAALDITPAPLTREHQRYLGRKTADFIARYNGEPLVLHPVLLTTSNGSERSARTDESGRVTFELPDDFSDVQAGRSNNRPADFAVSASLQVDGRHYHTTLSAPYYVSPTHWQSFSGGLVAMFTGVISGLVVLTRSGRRAGDEKAGKA